MNNKYKLSDLKLVAQRALLGEVSPSLRAVAVDWIGNTIIVYFYNHGKITSNLHDDFISIGTDIIANFNDAMIDEKMIRLDYPEPLPLHEFWVYKRKESSSE